MVDLGSLGTVVSLLGIGLVAATGAKRIGLSPIVGYLVAGALIGGHGLGLIHESKTTHLLAEIGVVFLLFDIGLHLSLRDLWTSRRDLFVFGPAQVTLCTLLFGVLLLVNGMPVAASILAAGALALSSTALIVQGLMERRMQSAPLGRKAIAILIFEDLLAVLLLVLTQMVGAENGPLWETLGLALIKAILAVAAVMLAGRYLLKPFFKFIVSSKMEEAFTIAALAVVLGTAMLTGYAGLSLPLGAFLAGLILSESEYCYLVKSEIRPFRGLLLGFFFLTVGMMLDIGALAGDPLLLVSILAGLVFGKIAIVFTVAKIAGLAKSQAVRLSLMFAQGSEFSFVIFALAFSQGILDTQTASILTAAVTLSMLITPLLMMLGDRLSKQVCETSVKSKGDAPAEIKGRVVIAGFNHLGRALARKLVAANIPYIVITDHMPDFTSAQSEGFTVSYGTHGDPSFALVSGTNEAHAVVLAYHNQKEIESVYNKLKKQFSDGDIITAPSLMDHDGVVDSKDVETALRDLLERLSVPAETITKIINRERREDKNEENICLIPVRAG